MAFGVPGTFETSGVTDAKGVFECNVMPGKHQVGIPIWTSSQTQNIDVEAGRPNTFTIQVPYDDPDTRIVAKVIDADGKPAVGAAVTFRFRQSKVEHHTEGRTTDHGGEVAMHLPASLSHDVWADAQLGDQYSDSRVKVKGSHVTLRLHRVPNRSEKVTQTLSSRINNTGEVDGIVTRNGHPLPDVVISLTNSSFPMDFVRSNSSGNFKLKNLPAGDVTVYGKEDDGLIASLSSQAYAHVRWVSPPIHVKVVANKVQNVELKVIKPVPLTIHVVDAARNPQRTYLVVTLPRPNRELEDNGETDESGVLRCKVFPGLIEVGVPTKHGYIWQPFVAREGGHNAVTVCLPFEEEGKRIVCKVIDADGKASAGTTVFFGYTDSRGKYQGERLSDG